MNAALLRHLRARYHTTSGVKSAIRTMQAALASPGGHVHIGPAGVAVEFVGESGGAARLSGSGLDHVGVAMPLLAMGLPAIDTRWCESRDDYIRAVLAAPLCAVDGRADPMPESGQWHGMSVAPLSALVQHWRQHGAAILNI